MFDRLFTKPVLLKEFFDFNFNEYVCSDLIIAYESLKDGNPNTARIHMDRAMQKALSNFKSISSSNHYYRFYRLNTLRDGQAPENDAFFMLLMTGNLSLTNPAGFNDSYDPLIKVWCKQHRKKAQSHQEKSLSGLAEEFMNRFRICCLTKAPNGKTAEQRMNAVSPLLWGHYTDGQKGICIEYKIGPSDLDRWNDRKKWVGMQNVKYKKGNVLNDDISLENSLLAKGKYWKYENEVRMIAYTPRPMTSDERVDLPKAEIVAIYMGEQIRDAYRKAIRRSAKSYTWNLYQMRVDSNDLSRFKAYKVN